MCRIADDAADAGAETHGITDDRPQDGADARLDEALHHDGEQIFLLYQAAVEKGQSGRHDHDHGGTKQQVRCIA